LVEGDVAGGAAVLVRGDKDAGPTPTTSSRRPPCSSAPGDPRGARALPGAVQLAPDLARPRCCWRACCCWSAGADAAKPVIESLRKKTATRRRRARCSRLSWVVSPRSPRRAAERRAAAAGDVEQLPAPLAAVPAMVDAAKALNKQDSAGRSKAIDSAINLAMTPALAAGLGFLAIEAGDEVVARKAALRALQFSGVYPRARTLAARVALLGGRIDERKRAIEGLDPASADVAVVRAVVAYESLETADLKSALEALGNSAVGPAFSALDAAPGVINGTAFPPPAELERWPRPTSRGAS
jgi:hypothetical protein